MNLFLQPPPHQTRETREAADGKNSHAPTVTTAFGVIESGRRRETTAFVRKTVNCHDGRQSFAKNEKDENGRQPGGMADAHKLVPHGGSTGPTIQPPEG